jgi:hypothetical protein
MRVPAKMASPTRQNSHAIRVRAHAPAYPHAPSSLASVPKPKPPIQEEIIIMTTPNATAQPQTDATQPEQAGFFINAGTHAGWFTTPDGDIYDIRKLEPREVTDPRNGDSVHHLGRLCDGT